jgi:alanine dehydrogenase
LTESKPLRLGLNTYNGHITYEAVATAMDKDFILPENALKG